MTKVAKISMNSQARPLVSIIIPSFNQGTFIRDTINSCLAQDYRPLEVLVFDGASKDETLSVLESINAPELTWISEPDNGVADAVNKGLARARGDILTIQSSDDIFLPGAVSAAVHTFNSHPDLGLVYGNVEYVTQYLELLRTSNLPEFDFCDYLGRFMYIPQPGTFFSRVAMESTGLWREEVSYAADADFWLRMACDFKVLRIGKVMAKYRYHDAQRDKQRHKIARDWEKCVNELIESGKLGDEEIKFARMGIQLAKYKYSREECWWYRTLRLYQAAIANPSALLRPDFPKRELIPGRYPIWSFMSKVKQSVGFRPREHRSLK